MSSEEAKPESRRLGRGLSALLGEARREEVISPAREAGLITSGPARAADAADEAELDDIYETERRLLYVACTRAREHLLLTGVTPTSEYLADFTS